MRRTSGRFLLATFALVAMGSFTCRGTSNAEKTQAALARVVTRRATPPAEIEGTAVLETPSSSGTLVVTDLIRLNVNLAGVTMSPDGSRLIGFDAGGYKIGAADGSGLEGIDPHAIAVEWAPDSRSFAMTVSDGPLSSEHQQLPLFVVSADDLSRRQIGMSDFPRYLQFLRNGDLAYLQDAQLHVWHAATGEDERPSTAAITGSSDGVTLGTPFQVSEDERFIAVFQDGELWVQNLTTGERRMVAAETDRYERARVLRR